MRIVLWTVFAAILAAAGSAAAGAWWGYQRFVGPGASGSDVTMVIEKGWGLNTIAAELTEAGVIEDPLVFVVGARVLAGGRPLQAGEYQFPARVSAREAMRLMLEGTTVQRRLTVPEGLASAEVLALLAAAEGLDGNMPTEVPAQGALLPETYYYSWGDSRADLLARMQQAMADTVAELWAKRDPAIPLKSPEEALTLASIVEKETGVAAERPRVAAVFINRINQGMPLQSDPTVVFALTEGKQPLERDLTHADLAIDHPYNTYANPGLPPGPIANPGRASLESVLHPLTTGDLYFVADGNGGHAFAETLEEHNRNVAKWRKLQDGAAK
jgi:UPF0755 protein